MLITLIRDLYSVLVKVAELYDTYVSVKELYTRVKDARRAIFSQQDAPDYVDVYAPLVMRIRTYVEPIGLLLAEAEAAQVDDAFLQPLADALVVATDAIDSQRIPVRGSDWETFKKLFKNVEASEVETRFAEALTQLAQAQGVLQTHLACRSLAVTEELTEMMQALAEGDDDDIVSDKLDTLQTHVVRQNKQLDLMVSHFNAVVRETRMHVIFEGGAREQVTLAADKQDLLDGSEDAPNVVEGLASRIGDKHVFYLTGAGSRRQLRAAEVDQWVETAWATIRAEAGIERSEVENPKRAVLVYGGDPFDAAAPDVAAVARGLYTKSEGKLSVVAVQCAAYGKYLIPQQDRSKYSFLDAVYLYPTELQEGKKLFGGYRRGDGEVQEIAAATRRAVELLSTYPGRVFVVGGGPVAADETAYFVADQDAVHVSVLPALPGLALQEGRLEEVVLPQLRSLSEYLCRKNRALPPLDQYNVNLAQAVSERGAAVVVAEWLTSTLADERQRHVTFHEPHVVPKSLFEQHVMDQLRVLVARKE